MGCGMAKRPATQGSERKSGPEGHDKPELSPAGPSDKGTDYLGLGRGSDPTMANKESATIPGSFIENRDALNGCIVCASPAQEKVHILDCGHAFCLACANEQIAVQLKSKQGNIMYVCKKCRAPKYLSNQRLNELIEMIWLSCGCAVDVLVMDKKVRAVAGLEKIVRFDLKEKCNLTYY